MRDYVEWHRSYEDPASSLSWRLRHVQTWVGSELDARSGPVRIVSACAGDGRDVLGVLAARPDASRVQATLVELHPDIAQVARDAATAAGLDVDVRTTDAGDSTAYVGAVPADVVLLVGILGNITDADIARTISAAPQLCAAGAVVIWSRGLTGGRSNDGIRAQFRDAGFAELHYAEFDGGDATALGAVRLTAPPEPLVPGQQLFTFLR